MIPLINGIAYDWAQIVLTIAGTPIAGVSTINYSDTQAMVDNYGAGSFPVARGFGKYEAKASIELSMEEVESITSAAPGRRLQNIPEFPIIVSFVAPNNTVVTHKLKNCRFKDNKRDMKTGDSGVNVSIELIVSHIDW